MANKQCPHCKSENVTGRGWKNDKHTFQCNDCKRYFTVDETESLVSDTYQETEKSIDIVVKDSKVYTPEEIIKKYGINTDKWKLVSYQVKTQQAFRKDRKVQWEVSDGKVIQGKVDDSGKLLVVPLTHTSVKFAPKTANDLTIKDIDNFFSGYVANDTPKAPRKVINSTQRLEITLADLHIGSMDEGIAKRVIGAVGDILQRTSHIKFAEIMLVFLGDTLHYDTAKKTTTNGTAIDYSMLPKDMYDTGETLILDLVSLAGEYAPVDVIWLEGNHDKVLSYGLFKGVANFYRMDMNVSVDVTHSHSKWRQFGNNLVLWTHGTITKKRIPDLVTFDARADFGKSKYVEIHAGHRHHQLSEDLGGMILRFLPTVAKRTDWEDYNGYRGMSALQAFVWDDYAGLTNIIPVSRGNYG